MAAAKMGGGEVWPVLALRIAAGDREAESTVAAYFLPRLRALLLQRTRDRDLAQELSQEAMIRALCCLRESKVRDAENLPSFVFGIARNLLSETFRRRERENLVAIPEDLNCAEAAGRLEWEQTARVREAVRELEPIDQKILLMTLVDGKKPAAIATELRMSGDVIRQRKHRAIQQLATIVNRAGRQPAAARLAWSGMPE